MSNPSKASKKLTTQEKINNLVYHGVRCGLEDTAHFAFSKIETLCHIMHDVIELDDDNEWNKAHVNSRKESKLFILTDLISDIASKTTVEMDEIGKEVSETAKGITAKNVFPLNGGEANG